MTTTSATPLATSQTTSLAGGAAGGLVGGLVFGAMMAADGMMPMIAQLVGSSSVGLGWVIHLAISLALGVGFALVLGRLAARGVVPALAAGVVWGVVWWVLGALVLMPARLGMDLFMINDMTMKSLMGHVIFGVLAAGVFAMVARRAAH